ncbi:MAG: hypothetical protein Fur0018_10980 [Anaerolineales bacterium]
MTATPATLVQQAQRAYQAKRFAEAAAGFARAQQAFEAQGEHVQAAEQANNASVAWLQAGDAQAALQAAEGTPDIFLAAADQRRAGMAWGNVAAALEALERLDEALEAYQQAADFLRIDPETRLHVMQAISALQLRTGKHLQALASMQAGLADIHKPSPKHRLLKRLLQVPLDWLNQKFS